jgi:hypothetical protein
LADFSVFLFLLFVILSRPGLVLVIGRLHTNQGRDAFFYEELYDSTYLLKCGLSHSSA